VKKNSGDRGVSGLTRPTTPTMEQELEPIHAYCLDCGWYTASMSAETLWEQVDQHPCQKAAHPVFHIWEASWWSRK
jgi:hypothetical protein